MPNPIWTDLSNKLLAEMKAGVPVLESEVVNFTMTLGSEEIGSIMYAAVRDFGLPVPIDEYSLTEINHAYHLSEYLRRCPEAAAKWGWPESAPTVIEWGGGYGAMAKVFLRVFPNAKYNIVDLPGPLMAQRRFLKDNGVTSVNGWGADQYLSALPKCDLFISTWALSESPVNEQRNVADHYNWFGAKHLLMAYQNDKGKDGFPESSDFEDMMREKRLDRYQIPAYRRTSDPDQSNWYVFQ